MSKGISTPWLSDWLTLGHVTHTCRVRVNFRTFARVLGQRCFSVTLLSKNEVIFVFRTAGMCVETIGKPVLKKKLSERKWVLAGTVKLLDQAFPEGLFKKSEPIICLYYLWLFESGFLFLVTKIILTDTTHTFLHLV